MESPPKQLESWSVNWSPEGQSGSLSLEHPAGRSVGGRKQEGQETLLVSEPLRDVPDKTASTH